MGIVVENVSKRFGNFQAINNISLEIASGSLVALLGASGSGKSTLLRLIAGLETPDSGRILLTGKDATHQSVQERRIGFVFQHYALFKHLTVRENIAFGLKLRKNAPGRVKQRVNELLDLVQLAGLGDRYPSQLSGGQRQRVALARSLAVEPEVLLLDEPFGALDAKVRKDLRAWLRRLHDEVHVTTVFVTHDREEAMEVADEIAIVHQGAIEQIGTPDYVYDHPANSFVMQFIGPVNVLRRDSKIFPNHNLTSNESQVFLRPHDVVVELTPDSSTVAARINRVVHLGWEVQSEMVLDDGQVVTAHLTRDRFDELKLHPQQRVFVKPKDAKAFPLHYSI